MGTIPIPSGATIDDPSQAVAPSAGIPIPQGATIDAAPSPRQQVAAGQGAIGPAQVPAGGGAIGPSAVMSGLTDYLHSGLVKMGLRETPGPTPTFPSEWPFPKRQPQGESDPLEWLATTAKKAWDLPDQLVPEAEEHLKNFMATVAGIKREPAQTPTTTQPAHTMVRGLKPEGLLEPGNIDLDKRPQVPTPGEPGKISTVRSKSFNFGGQEVLLPTVIGNRVVGDDEAIQHYRDTREHLGKFDTPEHATAYAHALHEEQDRQYRGGVGDAEGTNVWQAFPNDEELADHLAKMEVKPKTGTNNPGNLKDPNTREIRQFSSMEEGRAALIRQVKSWREGNPNWTIADFNRNYAPDKSHGGDNPEGTEARRNQYMMRAAQPRPTAEADPPPGFVVEPKAEDFASLPADVRWVQKVAKNLEPAERIIGGMASSAWHVSAPYIAMQLYKKATGQPNELNKVPGNAIEAFGLLLAGGPEEAAAPEAEAAEAAPKAVPKQLGMGAIEGEYLPPQTAGQLPPGQYAQPPAQQAALPPGQYAPPPPPTRLALPQRASGIPLPETFPEARQPIIKTTPSEPLPPLRTTPEEEVPVKKGRAARTKAAAQPAAKAAAETPAAERTAVGTEGEVKGMRLVQRGGKWYDSRTGEEYKWKVRTN